MLQARAVALHYVVVVRPLTGLSDRDATMTNEIKWTLLLAIFGIGTLLVLSAAALEHFIGNPKCLVCGRRRYSRAHFGFAEERCRDGRRAKYPERSSGP